MDNSHVIELDQNEINILISLANNITVSPSIEPSLFCKQVKQLSLLIPKRIREILTDFALNGSPSGFLLVKNIPLNDFHLPVTPSNNNRRIGETTILSKIQSILINVMGEMISYEAEGYGQLFQDIVPIKHMAKDQTSVSSSTELEIHTEQAFSNLKPDILSLSCLKGDENAFTYILPVNTIIENLNNNEIELLYQPLWKTEVDLSFKLNGNEFIDGDVRGPLSILNGSHNDPTLIFDQDLMTGITEESNNMIQKIVDIYYTHRISHNLKSGEIIFIDNNRAVHGRSSFSPKYDGNDRFLIRCFATFDLEKSSHARSNNNRMISAIYS
jgi:L-asparagine oxygenase